MVSCLAPLGVFANYNPANHTRVGYYLTIFIEGTQISVKSFLLLFYELRHRAIVRMN